MLQEELQEKTVLDILRKKEWEGSDVLKSINIKDVIYMVAKPFEDVPSSISVKSLKKLGLVFKRLLKTRRG